jgi:hypothetical protein
VADRDERGLCASIRKIGANTEFDEAGEAVTVLPVARTILIGDVHGCAFELSELLERVAPTADDRVVFVGDLVARGPDSRGVLRIVRELGALCVRGNHEEKLLAGRHARRIGSSKPKLTASHAALVETLDDEEWAQLEALPLWLDLSAQGLRVVHAGIVPGHSLEAQDPWMLTHIRSIDDDGTPSARWGHPWGALYGGPEHIVFGHNAQRVPQFHPFATGIDTACVYGGELTALVLPDGAPIPAPESRRDALVSVRAQRVYLDYGRPLPGA